MSIRNALKQNVFSVNSSLNDVLRTSAYVSPKIKCPYNVKLPRQGDVRFTTSLW